MAHIASLDELRELYRAPSTLVRSKVRSSLDPMSEAFIAGSPFLLLATTGPDGRVDVSPRGGPAGFVRVLDGGRLAIPDLNGNNLNVQAAFNNVAGCVLHYKEVGFALS